MIFNGIDVNGRNVLDRWQQVGIKIFRFDNALLDIEVFQNGVATALRDATAYLPFEPHRVDDLANVVYGRDALHGDLAGTGVYGNFGDIAAVNPGEVGATVAIFLVPVNVGRGKPAIVC